MCKIYTKLSPPLTQLYIKQKLKIYNIIEPQMKPKDNSMHIVIERQKFGVAKSLLK